MLDQGARYLRKPAGTKTLLLNKTGQRNTQPIKTKRGSGQRRWSQGSNVADFLKMET